jgi:hypothetical protein
MIAPIRSYVLSIIIRGAVLEIGTLNLFFNNFDLTTSPTAPGVADNAKLEIKIIKFDFNGIEIFRFFNSNVHRINNTHQLSETNIRIRGK